MANSLRPRLMKSHRWFSPPLHRNICTFPPGDLLLEATSRHLRELPLMTVPLNCTLPGGCGPTPGGRPGDGPPGVGPPVVSKRRMVFVRETTQKPAMRPPRGGAAVQFTVSPLAFI